MGKAERGVLVGIVVVVALLLRVAFVTTAKVQNPLRADAGQYAQYARNLCEHGVHSLATTTPPPPDSFRPPGYPLLLALCRWVGGESGWHALAVAVQVALGSLTVLLAYRLARQFVGFGPALLAAALTALSPHLVVSSAYVLTECVTAFLVALAFRLLLGARSEVRRLLAAAAFGAVVLCNETLVVLPLAVAWVLQRHGRRQALGWLAVALLPFLGWAVRNQLQPLALRGGERATASISHGSYPGMVFRDPRWFGFPYREDPAQPAFGSSWAGLVDVLGPRIAERPLRYASWYLLEKPVWLWGWSMVQGRDVLIYDVADSPYERQPVMRTTHAAMRWLHAPVMLLSFATACVVLWRRRQVEVGRVTLAAAVAVATLAYVPVIPDPRYLQPVRPLVFVLAGVGVSAVLGAWRRSLVSPAAAATATEGGGAGAPVAGSPSPPAAAPPAAARPAAPRALAPVRR